MVPFYGQGMNAGFEDVTVLDRLFAEIGDGRRVDVFAEYSRVRRRDAHAICDLALYNYWEMSTGVASPVFRWRHALHGLLHRLVPRLFVPLYTMVAFTDIPYAEVRARSARQELWANGVLAALGATAAAAAAAVAIALSQGRIAR